MLSQMQLDIGTVLLMDWTRCAVSDSVDGSNQLHG